MTSYPVLDYRKSWEENYQRLEAEHQSLESPKSSNARVEDKPWYYNLGVIMSWAIVVYFLREPVIAFLAALGR